MPIGDTGFIALSCIPDSQYYSSLVRAVVMLIVMIVAGEAFIIFLISRLSGNIVRPLAELNDVAMELAAQSVTLNELVQRFELK